MCLFLFGFDSWRVFSWDVMWACGIYFFNKYIYLGLSKETFYTSRKLDTSVLELMSMSFGVLAGCVCHWGFRAGRPATFIVPVSIFSLLYLWAFDRIVQSDTGQSGQRSSAERVWYEDLPYEQLERMYPFNWFNVNPVHMMRILHGVDDSEQSGRFHQQVVWQPGRSYLQPDLCFDYGHDGGECGECREPDTDSDQRDQRDLDLSAALTEAQAEARRVATTHAFSRTNSPYLVAASPTRTARTSQCPPLPPPPTATFRTVCGPFEPERTRTESLSVDCFSTSQCPTQPSRSV